LHIVRRANRGLARCNAAGLPYPRDDLDALAFDNLGQRLADALIFPFLPLLISADQARHQADIELMHLAARIGERIKAHVERAFAQRRELRQRLHQRRIGVDFELQRPAGLLLDFTCESPAQAIAKITLIDGAAGKLVRDFQRGRRAGGPREFENGRRRYGAGNQGTTAHSHGKSSLGIALWCRWNFASSAQDTLKRRSRPRFAVTLAPVYLSSQNVSRRTTS